MAKELKCKCGNIDCQMEIIVNNNSGEIIWLEVEDIKIDPIRLVKMLPRDTKSGDFVKTRIAFALDMNGTLSLIRQLQQAIIDKITSNPQ